MSFPRILLITPAAAAFPCAGGEVLRKICRALPSGSVCRASLQSYGNAAADDSVHEHFFPMPGIHWRLRRKFPGLLYESMIGARIQAEFIAAWCREIHANLLWVLAEDQAVSVAYHVKNKTALPLHLTFHDAPSVYGGDFAGYPGSFMPLYVKGVRKLLGMASSVDAVSAELLDHVRYLAGRNKTFNGMVFPPSVSAEFLKGLSAVRCYNLKDDVRRIGMCGTLRISSEQWSAFLCLLSKLPFNFEIVAFADAGYFQGKNELPGNVTLSLNKFLDTEESVIRRFRECGVHACYLGLWKDPARSLFCETSLSSKLAAYAAVGVPIIFDGPENSVVWCLLNKHHAGLLIKGQGLNDEQNVNDLFANSFKWEELARNVGILCQSDLMLETNMKKLSQQFCDLTFAKTNLEGF